MQRGLRPPWFSHRTKRIIVTGASYEVLLSWGPPPQSFRGRPGGRQAHCWGHEGGGYESGLETIYKEWAGISSGICGQNTHLCIFPEREPKAITRFSKGLYVPKCFRTWANPPGDTRRPNLYPEVPRKLWTPPRECWGPPHGLPSSWGSAFSVSSQARPVQMVGRRHSLGRAQGCVLLGSEAERPRGETALRAPGGVSAPRPNLPAPPCSSLCPVPGFCPGWSPPGLNHFALWSLSPLHPRPAPLPASASASLVFSPKHLSVSVRIWLSCPVLSLSPGFSRVSLTTAVPSLSLDTS